MNYLIEEETCERLGFDCEVVGRLASRMKRLASDCEKADIMIFAGCFGGIVLRPAGSLGAHNNLTDSLGDNCDGGDGGDQ